MGKNNRINLVCISDGKYLKYLRTLLKSLSLTNPNIKIYLTLVNIKPKNKIKASLMRIFKDIDFTFIDKKFKKSHHLKAFCANYRPHAIYELLNEGHKKILYVDVDSLIRKNLDKAYDLNDHFDIKIHLRNEDDPRFKVAAGVILVNNTPASLKFFRSWSENILKLETVWFADQITFYECYNQDKNKVRLKHLDEHFIDWNFKKASAIWTGKGKRKKTNLRYRFEILKIHYNFYLKKCDG